MRIFLVALLLAGSAQGASLAIINTDATCAGQLVSSNCGAQRYDIPLITSLVRTRTGTDSNPWADPTFKWALMSSVTQLEGCTSLDAPAPMDSTGGPCTAWAWFARPTAVTAYIATAGVTTGALYAGSSIKANGTTSVPACKTAAEGLQVARSYSCKQSTPISVAKVTAYPLGAPIVPPVIGSASLQWTPPTQNTDGSALTDLAGYRVMYGASASALTQVADVTTPAYTVNNLTAGAWVFAVKAYTRTGVESALSNVATKVIQ